MSEEGPTQKQRLATERRTHAKRIDALQREFCTHKMLNEEYSAHLERVSTILGEDDQPAIGSDGRYA